MIRSQLPSTLAVTTMAVILSTITTIEADSNKQQQQRTVHLERVYRSYNNPKPEPITKPSYWPKAEDDETNYYWSKPEQPEHTKPYYYYYNKSGKGAKGGKSSHYYYGKSSKGSKGGKGSKVGGYYDNYEPEPEPYEQHESEPYWPAHPDPETESEEPYIYYYHGGKSGKGSKGSKSKSSKSKSSKGGCDKSGKGSKGSSDCFVEVGDGQWTFHYFPLEPEPYWSYPDPEPAVEPYWSYPDPEPAPEPPDESAPGICGPPYDGDGLECDIDYGFCTEIGTEAECGTDYMCYDKELCPMYATEPPLGVCGVYGSGGLECAEVITYCSEPGEHAECGTDRTCYDAGLCGFGDGWNDDGYGGVCGMSPTANGKKSKLDCEAVTTKCTEPDKYAECAYGAKCFDVSLCDEPLLHEVCFTKGKIVECSNWGNDGYGKGIAIPFTYTVDTDGKVPPEKVILPIENAILDDVAETIEGSDKYSDFSGKISAAPEDYIADNDTCGDGNAIRCSVVKGEMTIYPTAGWNGDVYDPCLATDIIELSMEGNDYTEIDHVTGAKYRNSDVKGCGVIVASAATITKDEDLSAGALAAIWFAALALIALAFLLVRRRRRKAVREDISLISDDLIGELYDFDDPYANTTDVHKCTSKVCPICNNRPQDPRFSPATKGKVDMSKIKEALGIGRNPASTTVSPTSVNDTDAVFYKNPFDDDDEAKVEKEDESADSPPPALPATSNKGSIMRLPYFHSQSDQPLPPINDVAHESDETDLDSVAHDGDNSTVPPPPPMALHPAYQQRDTKQRDSDEESV